MTITTTGPIQTTTTPNDVELTTLSEAARSGIERGVIAAGILDRMVPTGVQIEEYNLGAKCTTRGVFLHQGGVDQINMYFIDGTSEVSVHIEDYEDGENFDRFIPVMEMLDMVRGYYQL